MTRLDTTRPDEVVRAFVAEMNRWELEATQSSAVGEGQPDQVDQTLAAILARFCTPCKQAVQPADPPAYDPALETVLEIVYQSPFRVYISTRHPKHPHQTFRYVLVKRGRGWLIDARRVVDKQGSILQETL